MVAQLTIQLYNTDTDKREVGLHHDQSTASVVTSDSAGNWLCLLHVACCHLVDVLVPAGERHEPRHQRQDPDPAHHHLDHADVAPGDQ